MILVINTALDKMSTATREALVNYMAANGISWSWQQEAPFAHLTIDEPLKFPSFADLDPAHIEQLRDAFAKPATSRFSTATGLDLDRLAPISVPPRQEGETDEAFRQRILHTHQLSKPIRHARCNPLLAAPYAGVVFKGEGAYNGLATELSKMTPDTFREQYECTPTRVWRCPFCNKMPEYTHRDGLPVCKCADSNCKGSERWLEYDDFAELNPWIQHNGGPCPVRHEEVQAQLRGHDKSVTYVQGWPERFNWHWGRPVSATTSIDVLRWRRV